MKRKFKRIASLVLAAVMVFAMAMPAMAEAIPGTGNMTEHTFKAYQIFSGTQEDNPLEEGAPNALGDIKWGSGINETNFLSALKADKTVVPKKGGGSDETITVGELFQSAGTAAEVAKILGDQGWGEASPGALAFAKLAYANIISGTGIDTGAEVTAGYYLVVDETEGFEGTDEDDVVNLALLQFTTAGKFEAKSKVDKPTVEKKVKEVNDTTGNTSSWQDAADYDIGDTISFQLKGTLPAEGFEYYETYKYMFHDTLSEGLTYNNNAKVYLVDSTTDLEIDDPVTAGWTDITSNFVITGPGKDGKLAISCEDLKKVSGVAEGKVIVVRYTATLNENAVVGSEGNPNTVTLEYSNNPNDGGEGTGTTPEDKVVVFTFTVDVKKTDGAAPLKGATFNLLKWVSEDDVREEVKKDPEKDEAYPAPTGSVVTPGKWVSVKEITSEKAVDGTEFVFKGEDSGIYKLVESVTPKGYNTADPVDFTIVATYEAPENKADPKLKDLAVEPAGNFTVNKEADGAINGVLETTVVNNEGTTLPETGGIGTTIFYVVGSVLVLGAVILLVTKRRMKG